MAAKWSTLLVLLLVSACANRFEAGPDARISKEPGAPGYLIVGLATQSYRNDFGHTTQAVGIGIARRQGGNVVAARSGCGSMQGFYGSKPCDLTKPDRQVLVVQPGDWLPLSATERLNAWGTRKTLSDMLPFRTPVHVDSGEVVYIGDFTVVSDYEAQSVKLVENGRDDAGAARALAAYPGLRDAPIVYRAPTTAPWP